MWRLVGLALSRLESHAIGALYIEAMDDLFAKDAGFFHNNFAGSLTKRVLGYARRFEDVSDVFAFSICGNLFPLVFALVVLAQFSGWLLVVLVSHTGFQTAMLIASPFFRPTLSTQIPPRTLAMLYTSANAELVNPHC